MQREDFISKAAELAKLCNQIEMLDTPPAYQMGSVNPGYFKNIRGFLRVANGWIEHPIDGVSPIEAVQTTLIRKTAAEMELFGSALSRMYSAFDDEGRTSFFSNEQTYGFLADKQKYRPSEILQKGGDILKSTLEICGYLAGRIDILQVIDRRNASVVAIAGAAKPKRDEILDILTAVAKVTPLVGQVGAVSREMAVALEDKRISGEFVRPAGTVEKA